MPPPKPKGGWNRKEGAAAAAASPYMMFCKTERAAVVAANPTFTFGQIGKALGKAWGKLPEAQRAEYARAAEAAAAETAKAAAEAAATKVGTHAETMAPAAAGEEVKSAAAAAVAADAAAASAAEESPVVDASERASRRRHFRLHPKGVGVVCIRPEGLEPGTFVNDYLGEIYSPWWGPTFSDILFTFQINYPRPKSLSGKISPIPPTTNSPGLFLRLRLFVEPPRRWSAVQLRPLNVRIQRRYHLSEHTTFSLQLFF